MSKVFIEESTLTSIGDAIREKNGTTDLIAPLDMAQTIIDLPTGGGKLKWALIEGDNSSSLKVVYDLSQYITDIKSKTWFLFVRQLKGTATYQRGDIAVISPLLGSTYGYTGHVSPSSLPYLDTTFSSLVGNSGNPLFSQGHTDNKVSFDATTNVATASCSSQRYSFGKYGILIYIGE